MVRAPAHLLDIHVALREIREGRGGEGIHTVVGKAILEPSTKTLRCSLVLCTFRFWQRRDSWAARMALLIRYSWCPCTVGFPCQRPFGYFRIGTLEQYT